MRVQMPYCLKTCQNRFTLIHLAKSGCGGNFLENVILADFQKYYFDCWGSVETSMPVKNES